MAPIARPGVLRAGDEVRVAGRLHTVVALSGTSARLVDSTGDATVILLPHLLSDPSFALVSAARPPLPPLGALDSLPEQVMEQARWWERHLVEVLTGLPPPTEPGTATRLADDPSVTTLRQRELAKVAELAAQGHQVSLATVQWLRRRYEQEGLWALVDRRVTRGSSPAGRVDPRVVEAVRRAIAGETDRSTGTVGRLGRRTEQLLAATHGPAAPPLPSRPTFYRLAARLSEGRHTFGSARTGTRPSTMEHRDASGWMANRNESVANQSEAPQVTALSCLALNDNGHLSSNLVRSWPRVSLWAPPGRATVYPIWAILLDLMWELGSLDAPRLGRQLRSSAAAPHQRICW